MRTGSYALIWMILTFSVAAADDWPQFRGPGGQGCSEASGLPLKWSETENITWKTPITGLGWSSPVVLGDQIWMTTADEKPASEEEAKKRLRGNSMASSLEVAASVTWRAVCVDRKTGKVLRDVKLFTLEYPAPIHQMNSYASPTPVLEPGRVYCDFGTYGTVCLDSTSGKILWERTLPIDHQVGPGSSPALYGDLLVLVRDGCDKQYITALDKKTGKTVWKTDRPPMATPIDHFRKAYSTPLVIKSGGRDQMIVPGAQWVVAYEPASGKEIWRVDYGRQFSTTSRPVFGHGMAYIGTGFIKAELWAIRPDGQGDVTKTHVAWKATRQIPKRSSPVLAGKEIYVVSDNGVATCFDAETGETRWTERMAGDYSVSPVYAGGRIYFFSQDARTTVLKPGKEYTKLAENQLEGRMLASPAFVDNAIFLRTNSHLYRIENRSQK